MKTSRRKTIAALAILLFAFFLSTAKGQDLDPYQFFPANVGDRWEYTRAGPDLIYTIIRDSIDVNDSSRFLFYEPPVWRGAKYRIDKSYNVFNTPAYDNRLVYKLDAMLGDSWMVRFEDRIAAKVLNISEAYIFGKQTTVKTIGFYREGVITKLSGKFIASDTGIQYWQKLAYGFGIISQENGVDKPILLRGCRINGITYGTVDVKDELKIVPSEFVLHQNYPNPFNPSTTISFSLPKSTQVVIKVYDVLGKEVKELANDHFAAGMHSVRFNSVNLSSGVYFYRLATNQSTKTMKMILQK